MEVLAVDLPQVARGESVNLITGEVMTGGGGGRGSRSPGPDAARLSSAQIRPQGVVLPSIEYAEGGRFAHLHMPSGRDDLPHGVRAAISGFTWRSRRLLLRHINSIDRGQVDPANVYLCTLTYPKSFPSAREAKGQLMNVLKRFRRAFGPVALFWKIEPQERGAPHFHLLVFATSQDTLRLQAAWWADNWHDVAGQNDPYHLAWHRGQLGNRHCCEPIKTWNGVTSYAAKYIGKPIPDRLLELWKNPGRWWGKQNFDLLPVHLHHYQLTRRAAVAIRRALAKYVEHQPIGQWRCEDPDGFGGRRLIRRTWSKLTASAYADHGFIVRAVRRRHRRRGGGVSCFAPAVVVEQLLRWWRGHVHAAQPPG